VRKKIREPRRSTELVEEIDFWKNLDDQPLSVKRQAASPAKMVMCQPNGVLDRMIHWTWPEASSTPLLIPHRDKIHPRSTPLLQTCSNAATKKTSKEPSSSGSAANVTQQKSN
jgi:hypothetical protein